MLPSGALVWPPVTQASGQRARSLDYYGSREKGCQAVAGVGSDCRFGRASATTEAMVRSVLMSEVASWLDSTNILLVW